MHQALVTSWSETPKYTTVPELPPPGPDEVRIKVIATGVHRVVLSRAAGRHYSSGALPHTPGVDGVGTTDDEKQVYFTTFGTGKGSMSEYINLPKSVVTPIPEGLDPTQIAGLVNPAMSSWMALRTRATDLPTDFTILVLGATSASGRIAISLARLLGAKRIIGAARNEAALANLDIDQAIVVTDDVSQTDFSSLGHVDVILDYIFGPLAAHLLNNLKTYRPTQYVQIGVLSGVPEVNLQGAALRSNNLTLRGSGTGAWSMEQSAAEMPELLQKMKDLPKQPVKVAKLEEVEALWEDATKERLVFTP